MLYNMRIALFIGLVLGVAAVPPFALSPGPANQDAKEPAPLGIPPISTSSSSLNVESLQTNSIPPHELLSTSQFRMITPGPHATHSPSVLQTLPAIATTLPQAPSTIASATPLAPTLLASISPQAQPTYSQSRTPPVSSTSPQELATSTLPLSNALRSPSPPSDANIAPTVRFILIGILAGVPTLTVIGFIVTLRWRRAHRQRALSDSKGISNTSCKERKSARFSTFFGVSHGYPEYGRKGRSQLYATSIHSTAGLAGVGAHRGGGDNSVPPMIHYVKLPESGQRAGVEDKANFENPFGTPPPVVSGFVIAPSRVSPHIPQTPPLQWVQLPSVALQNTARAGVPVEQSDVPSVATDRLQAHDMPHRNTQLSGKPHLDGHDPETTAAQPTSNRPFLSPNPPANVRTHKQPPLSDMPLRASVAPSVYGGIASPRIPGPATPMVTPPLPYRAPSPVPDQTTLLPYLPSRARNLRPSHEQLHAVTPIIVIQAASTADSESEYEDDSTTESGDDRTEPQLSGRGVPGVVPSAARRGGLVGSPPGFVPPSSTFSTVSSYSVASHMYASASSVNRLDSSGSSNPSISASSSDDSSITIKAAPTSSGTPLRRMNGAAVAPRANSSLWLPTNFEELERGRRARRA